MSMKQGFDAVDTFDRRVAEMGLEGRAAGAPAPAHVVTEEPKGGVWTGNNNLGYEVAFAPNADNRQTILKMPEWGFPETWTISLGITESVPVDPATFNGRNITAIIEFGVGGITQTIEVDWKLGTQITLVTNSLNVIAEFANIDIGAGEGDFKLSVQVCRGNRPSNVFAPTKTPVVTADARAGDIPVGTVLEAVLLSPGEETHVNIPRFATAIRVVSAVVPATAGGVNRLYTSIAVFEVNSGFGLGSVNIVSMDGVNLLQAGGLIPVFGSAKGFSVFNNSAVPGELVAFSVFMELAG
jgi:hypothetical protein